MPDVTPESLITELRRACRQARLPEDRGVLMGAAADTIARLTAQAEALADALEGVLGPDVSANERFELLAEQFYRETGIWAPGKDIPAACGADDDYPRRQAAWRDWHAARITAARAALVAYRTPEATEETTPTPAAPLEQEGR